MNFNLCGILLLFIVSRNYVNAHGYMSTPPSRSYIWHDQKFKGLDPHVNYDYMSLNCGGIGTQIANGGKCGVCGDSFKGPKEHEPGPDGKYAQGIISKCYTRGSVIDVTVHLTMNHLGWMEWRLCEQDDPQKTSTQDCLDDNLLKIDSVSGDNWFKDGEFRLKIDTKKQKSDDYFHVSLSVPNGVQCEACVLQWIYKAGNNWGCDNVDGVRVCGIGHGDDQEEFRNCADIAIRDSCPNDVLNLPLNQKHNHDHSSDSNSELLHLSKLPEDHTQHDVHVHWHKEQGSGDLQPPAMSINHHAVRPNNNPTVQSPASSQEQAHGRLLQALQQHLRTFNPSTPRGLSPQASRHNHDSPNHPSLLGTRPMISSSPTGSSPFQEPSNSRNIGTCHLKMQSSPSNQQLKRFCSDRNCQVDYVKQECICY